MYQIELVDSWPAGIPADVKERIEKIIAWEIPHESTWYPQAGRTLVIRDEKSSVLIKVKGAGFFNPSGVSFSGTRRTTMPVPEGPVPIEPLQEAFQRDLIHVDPADEPPHRMESVHSTFAPVGGMTLQTAMNDQHIFAKLTSAGLPSNRPLATYKYHELFLNEQQMGVSVAQLPANTLSITPYNLYLAWQEAQIGSEAIDFFKGYTGNREFTLSNATHRLTALAKLARVAGELLIKFSTQAGLYRFSGSPDNWNIRFNTSEPFFFSDVDTSRSLDNILPAQWGWEVLRNLISAIHQWFYFFLPCLTYAESGYSASMLQERSHDFVRAILYGFFSESDQNIFDKTMEKMWQFFTPVLQTVEQQSCVGLRTGEYELRKHYPRPVFYFVMLTLLSDMIQGSKFQQAFSASDTTPEGIREYVKISAEHSSHVHLFPEYSLSRLQDLIDAVK